jgi:O-antigen/teichoic acid export membrane protein
MVESASANPGVSVRESARILLNTWYRAIADIGGKVASFVLYVVMARKLGVAGFGAFAFGISFVTLVTSLANFGQDSILTREVARNRERVHGYVANTFAIKLLVGIPVLVIAVAALAAIASERTWVVALFLGVAVLAERLTDTCFAVYQSYEQLNLIPVVLITQRFLTAVVAIVALTMGAGVVAVAVVYLGGSLLALGLAVLLLFRRVVSPRMKVTPETWLPLMRAAASVGLASAFYTILFRADMSMLAAFKSAGDVGNYGAAYRLLESTLFFSWSVGAAVYPVFSRLRADTNPPVGLVFERSLKLVAALTLPVAFGAAVLAGPVIRTLYGAQFHDAPTALALLAPTIALYPISYIAGYLLVSQDRQRVTTVVYGVIALENVLLNLYLIPSFSLNGAALGTSISEALGVAVLITFSVRVVGSLDWVRILGGPLLAAGLALVTMVLLKGNLAVAITFAGVVDVVALFAFERLVYPDDARAILNLLPIRRTA